jgi:Secretion system C-terminal sorting domain
MKYKILLSILLIFGLKGSDGLAQCVNGTETNPSAPMPTNADFKTNTFNWQQPSIPVMGKFTALPPTLNSPFHSTANYLSVLQGGYEGDSKPSDGWQLIKQDFGYAYANNSWQGRTLFNATFANQQSRAYMMLYNKYSGTLRILGVMDRLSLQDQIVVKLKLFPKNLSKSNHNELEFSALFNRYNKQETALDLPTKVIEVTSPAQVPSTGSEFFYADFQLSYDPCVCFFKSALEVSFQVKQSSTLQLTGRLLGQNVDITQKNALPSPDYLTSVWNQNVPNQPYNQQYSSLLSLQNDIKNRQPSAADGFGDFLGILKLGAKVLKSYNPTVSALGSVFSFLKVDSTFDKAGKDATTLLDFFSVSMDKNEKPSNPSVITAEISAIGSVSSTSPVNGAEFLVGTPGSKDAGLLPEYPVSALPSQGTKPMYPMYNEMTGKFAVVRTPEIMVSYLFTGNVISYKLTDALPTISYAFNPIVDAEKTRVFVAIEFISDNQSQYVSKFLPIENARNMISTNSMGNAPPTANNFNVVFMIFYQFKPNANGDIKIGEEIVKVRPKLTVSPTSIFDDPRNTILSATPTNLNLGATTYNQGQIIYSFGNITITGNLMNNSSQPIIIIAQGEVNITPGVNITGNIEFRSGQVLPPGFPVDPPLPPMTAAQIQTFCTSSVYKAKDQTFALQQNDPTTDKVDVKENRYKSLIFNISPNPFSDQITIDLNIEEATNANLDLSNAVGQTLKSMNLGMKEKGSYQETIETNDLAPGIYFLTLRTQNGTETKKIVKQ